VKTAKNKGIACFLWDNGDQTATPESPEAFAMFNRGNNTFYFPEILTGLMNGVNNATPPTPPNSSLDWENGSVSGTWTWGTYNDSSESGTSTISVSETNGKRTYSGSIVSTDFDDYTGGYAGWAVKPDTSTLPYLKAATSISFKVTGDNKTYTLQVPTSDITDSSYYQKTFTVTAAETTVTIPLTSLVTPGWGQSSEGTAFNKQNATELLFQASLGTTGEGTYNITIWDLKLNQ